METMMGNLAERLLAIIRLTEQDFIRLTEQDLTERKTERCDSILMSNALFYKEKEEKDRQHRNVQQKTDSTDMGLGE